MTRRIILHIGSPKCGSTYLQNILHNSAERLLQHGVHYPAPTGTHPGNAGDLENITAERLQSYFIKGCDTVFLSHEDLYAVPKRSDTLVALTRDLGIDVQILVFLRPFSEFIFGDYSQFMKQQFELFLKKRQPYGGRDFEAFAKRRVDTLKPSVFLTGWRKRFATPIILDSHRNIRPVIEGLIGPDAIETWELPPDKGNPSLRMEDCDRIAEAIRSQHLPDDEIRAMFKQAFHDTAKPDAGRSPERIALVESLFRLHNKSLLKKFGYDNRIQPQSD